MKCEVKSNNVPKNEILRYTKKFLGQAWAHKTPEAPGICPQIVQPCPMGVTSLATLVMNGRRRHIIKRLSQSHVHQRVPG